MISQGKPIQGGQAVSGVNQESSCRKMRKRLNAPVHDGDRAALVTLCLPHLPFHPSCFLGYGSAILAGTYDLDVIDLNAETHLRNVGKLKPILDRMDKSPVVSDALLLHPFYEELGPHIDEEYEGISWEKYSLVYVTPPSWFPTVPTEAVLRLSGTIKRASPNTRVRFVSNSLGSWTNEDQLKKNGVEVAHLNSIGRRNPVQKPFNYDRLPTPFYQNRGKYMFDLLPFMLKHGCSWGRCRFCSLCRGWNSGYLERSAKAVIKEVAAVIDQHDPAALVCRDNSLKGRNLVEFCEYFRSFNKPWCGMSRADLSRAEIEALRKAGCRSIFFGLESGSDRTLSAINKGITSKQMSDFIKTLHSSGIAPAPSLMIGIPDEKPSDFEKTIQFLIDHRRYFDVVNVYPFIATPASEFGSQEKQLDKNVPLRLFRFIQTCEDLGLKVCVGEQCMEYFAFKWLLTCDIGSFYEMQENGATS